MARHKVCAADELAVGDMKPFKVAGTSLILYHLEEGFFATQSHCTHLFAPLARGKIVDNCLVQCPFHRARFDVRSGEVVDWANFPPGVQLLNALRGEKALATYDVTLEDGDLFVDC